MCISQVYKKKPTKFIGLVSIDTAILGPLELNPAFEGLLVAIALEFPTQAWVVEPATEKGSL